MSRRYYRRRSRSVESDIASAIVGVLILVAISASRFFSAQTFELVLLLLALVAAVIVGIVIIIELRRRTHEERKLRALTLSNVQVMDGLEFEKYLMQLLKSRGYTHMYLTPHTDLGVDIVGEKDGSKWAIQAKRYTGKVGVEAVYQVVGGRNYYKCQQTMVVTTSFYTPDARKVAESNGTLLIDRDTLAEWIIGFQGIKSGSPLNNQNLA